MISSSAATVDEERINLTTAEALSPSDAALYTGDPMRWVALLQLCLLGVSNSVQSVIFATIVDQSREYFSVSNQQLNWLAVIFNILFFFVGPFTQQVYRVFGLKRGLALQSLCNCMGIALKLVCAIFHFGFPLLFVSQTLAALGTVPGAPPALAAAWFPDSQRTLATAIAAAANNLGNAVGLLLPPLVVISATEAQFVTLFAIVFVCTLVDLCIIVFVVPRRPTHPPSAAAAEIELLDAGTRELTSVAAFIRGTYSSMFAVLSNRSVLLLVVSFGLVNGVYWALTDFSAQAMQPFGITEAQVGGMGFTSIAIGSVMSLFVSLYIDVKRRYWVPAFIAVTGTALFCAGMNWLLYFEHRPSVVLVWVLWSALGTVEACAAPIGFEFGAELSFPHDAALVGALIMTASNGIASLTILGINPSIPNNPDPYAGLTVTCILSFLWAVASVLIYFVPEDLRRRRFEKDGRTSSPQSNNAHNKTQLE